MGKQGKAKSHQNRKRAKQLKPTHQVAASSSVSAAVQRAPIATAEQRLPPAFPAHLPTPAGFLRDEEPYKESFRVAIETAYEGCVWDEPSVFDEPEIQNALTVMDNAGLFRTDVTQPAGLGAKCAKTYVTRCLLGEEGNTYRYLGLRMFAHPWNGNGYSPELQAAIRTVLALNQTLTQQADTHLDTLSHKRFQRNLSAPVLSGRVGFDVSLINKMQVTPSLKKEPMFETSKCSVSWHADSSLEHYSTIGVYQTMFQNDQKKQDKTSNAADQNWSVALRVTPNAEGDKATRMGEISVLDASPPVAISLPSGSAYYLLDDHNHHHQHAVLAPSSQGQEASTRFSSTHRLLRQGHNVHHIIARCHTICSSFHRKGPKRWRSEQLLLNELETEWLRQFYIQGEENKQLLWGYWEEPMRALLKYWGQLEARTRQVAALLLHASEERCGVTLDQDRGRQEASRADRKLREKRKKALAMIQDSTGKGSPKESIYDNLASLIEERSVMRQKWEKREQDPVFKRLSAGCQPIPFPVTYNAEIADDGENAAEVGRSPMLDGSSDFLSKLADHMKTWGTCYDTQFADTLPEEDLLGSHASDTGGGGLGSKQDDEHTEDSAAAKRNRKPKKKKDKPVYSKPGTEKKKRRF